MKRFAALLCVLAAPAMAAGTPPSDRVAKLETAIAAAGCEVNDANQAAVLKSAGMTEAEGMAIVSYLMGVKRAVGVGDDILKLVAGPCE
ncbi:MAG: hypothetical protein WBN04_02195 [Paracoccaceae bacterium]